MKEWTLDDECGLLCCDNCDGIFPYHKRSCFWRVPTPEEAQAEYDAATPAPISKERIEEIVQSVIARTRRRP